MRTYKPKKPVKQRVPRTRGGGTYTEAQFWTMIRSALRQKSRFWKPISLCKQHARRPFKGKGRQKWEYQCATCKKWYSDKETVVHHKIPAGTLKSFDDLPQFVSRLFCEEEDLMCVCNTCHSDIHKSDL